MNFATEKIPVVNQDPFQPSQKWHFHEDRHTQSRWNKENSPQINPGQVPLCCVVCAPEFLPSVPPDQGGTTKNRKILTHFRLFSHEKAFASVWCSGQRMTSRSSCKSFCTRQAKAPFLETKMFLFLETKGAARSLLLSATTWNLLVATLAKDTTPAYQVTASI